MDSMNQRQTIELLKALADETRLSIVKHLSQYDTPVAGCEIVNSCASFLRLSQPAMSHHFARLVDAGILIEEKSGTSKMYHLDRHALERAGIDIEVLTNGG